MKNQKQKTPTRRELTFDQHLTLMKLAEFRHERNRKRLKWLYADLLKPIWEFAFIMMDLILCLYISVLAGNASEPIIYYLNQPMFGTTYAHFASYAVTALFFSYIWRKWK